MSVQSPDAISEDLRGKFAAIRRWQNVSRGVTVGTVVAVAGMFYVFATTTRERAEANFRDEARVEAAVQGALPQVQPLVTASLTQVFEGAAPVYQQLAAERYRAVRESIGERAMIRLQHLPEDGGKLMGARLAAAFDRVLKRIEPDLAATFPSLTDAQRRDLMIHHFGTTIEQRNEKLAGDVMAVWVNEQSNVNGILEKFELPPDEMAPADDRLRKELVRTLVLLAEQELEEMDGSAAPRASKGLAAGHRGDAAPVATVSEAP
jgi:hypothetical protein